jgi:hypothetical protein
VALGGQDARAAKQDRGVSQKIHSFDVEAGGAGHHTAAMHLLFAAGKAASKAASSRHTQEIGVLIAMLGGVILVVSGVLGMLNFERRTERLATVLAGVLVTAGMLTLFFGLHK